MKIPGITAVHAVVTPSCRVFPGESRGDAYVGMPPEEAAFEAAVARLREEYRTICRVRRDGFTAHVVLSIEGPE